MLVHQNPFIARLSGLLQLNAADLAGFEKILESECVVKKRKDLIFDGAEYRNLCFVKDGYALRYKLLRNGKRQILNVVLPGDVIGLLVSFFDRSNYSVVALSDLTFSACRFDAYIRLCYRHPQFGLALSSLAVQEAAFYAERVVDVGRRTPPERLARFLLEIHERLRAVGRAAATSMELPFSQEVMADMLGLSVPHLNRVMQQLRAEKLIAGRLRVVDLLDVAALQTLAHYQPMIPVPIPLPENKM